jgi:hypothetical protein
LQLAGGWRAGKRSFSGHSPCYEAGRDAITLKSLFEWLAEDHEMTKKHVHDLMAGMIEKVTEHLAKGAAKRSRSERRRS